MDTSLSIPSVPKYGIIPTNHMKTNRPDSHPEPTIRRYPAYLRVIRDLMSAGEENISSAVVAEQLGLDPVLTRKDLAMAGVPGRPRRGYPARKLADAIERALGWNKGCGALLVGVGSLGHALLGYTGFAEQNLSIVAAFDADPLMIGQVVHNVRVRAMDDLPAIVADQKIKLGILTVPGTAAQACADALVQAGVVGIWNFTPTQIDVPDGVIVQHVDLAQSLAVLSHAINRA